ncbi:MAG: amino acid decarboxylase [Faecalibacterium sp.]
MSVTTPIVDFVRQYQQSGISRLHMPGHKGQNILGWEGSDITEIAGADELYEPGGIIAESEANATRLFGTAHTFYSTEGSSQCIRAMLFLALQAAPQGKGRPVLLAARNAHKALLYAAALLDFDVEWLWPAPEAAGALCSCPVMPQQLREALARLETQGQRPFGVYVTSPDYLGGMQDIPALAEVCRESGIPLLVDNAHGAYLRFLPGEQHPIAQGAAMCCDSAHKTLPVLTGGAYLHLGKNAPVQDKSAVRGALALFGSTSPSYLILQSLDRCNQSLAEGYPLRLVKTCMVLRMLRADLKEWARQKGCPVPLALDGPRQEPLKLTLDAAALGCTGGKLAQTLRCQGIECEYADPRYVVLMPTPENPPQDLERVRMVLKAQLDALAAPPAAPLPEAEAFAALAQEAVQKCTIRQAVFAAQERIPASQALGRVCAMPTVSCPPAIPVVVSGEVIGPAAQAVMARCGVETVAVLR